MATDKKPNTIEKILRVKPVWRAVRLLGGPVLLEQLLMYDRVGYWPNLRRPRSINEHLARTKMFERDPRWPVLGDKLLARDYVRDRVGAHVLSEVYAASDTADGLDFGPLPRAFALKPSHGSRWWHLVTDKDTEDIPALRLKMRKWLSSTFGRWTQEWWYTGMRPRVFAEELLVHPEHPSPPELKFWTFGGRVELLTYHHDRTGAYSRTFHDRQMRLLPFGRPGPNTFVPKPPPQFDEMVRVAERLAQGFRFLRVDLYAMPKGRIVFGELTLCPAAGRGPFVPTQSDFDVGRLWHTGPVPPLSPEPFVPGPGAFIEIKPGAGATAVA